MPSPPQRAASTRPQRAASKRPREPDSDAEKSSRSESERESESESDGDDGDDDYNVADDGDDCEEDDVAAGEDGDDLDGDGEDDDYGFVFEDDDSGDDSDDCSRGISEEERAAMDTIQELLMVSEERSFFRQLTAGLAASVICDAAHPDKHTIDLLLDKSFHKHELSAQSRALIREQTLRGMAALQPHVALIGVESHKIFCVLAQFRKSRVVAAMMTRVAHVVAGILILQLSLDELGAAERSDEVLCEAALAGQAALIALLQGATPLQALCHICNIVIANAPHVQRARIHAHIKQQRAAQLYDKPPIIHGVAARTTRSGLFFVVLRLTGEGDLRALGGCDAITKVHGYGAQYAKCGQVSRLPADDEHADPSIEAYRFPHKQTAYAPPHSLRVVFACLCSPRCCGTPARLLCPILSLSVCVSLCVCIFTSLCVCVCEWIMQVLCQHGLHAGCGGPG